MHVRLDFSSRITNNIFARKGQHTQQTTNDKAKTGTKKKQRSKQLTTDHWASPLCSLSAERSTSKNEIANTKRKAEKTANGIITTDG